MSGTEVRNLSREEIRAIAADDKLYMEFTNRHLKKFVENVLKETIIPRLDKLEEGQRKIEEGQKKIEETIKNISEALAEKKTQIAAQD